MATVGDGNLTLADWAKRLDPKGKVDSIVEILNETNEILDDMTFIEGNLPTGHRHTIRAGLPTAAWRLLNYGVAKSKSRTVQVQDSCGMLEVYSEVDKALADLNGNTATFRLSEDRAFIESMNQELVDTFLYGNTESDPEKFLGISPRFDSTSADNGGNIILGGSSDTDNSSIWLVVWGPATAFMIFPKGSKAGLYHQDLGEVTIEDAAGGLYQGYRSHYKWDVGFTVRDWRYVVRIPNIDNSTLTKTGSTGADLVDLMTQALELIPHLSMGRPAFYCNKTIRSFLRRQIKNSNNVNISMEEVAGKKVVAFDGIPVRKVDALTSAEALIS